MAELFGISIHALLAESDRDKNLITAAVLLNFYPRSPCGERLRACPVSSPRRYFYPRSPCGERLRACPVSSPRRYFYPRSPCGERQTHTNKTNGGTYHISIHALLAESDGVPYRFKVTKTISIHALLAESDTNIFGGVYLCIAYFYPRSPCGERPWLFAWIT